MPNADPDGYQWPDIFLAADPAAAVATKPSNHRLCADALMGRSLCMAGNTPCPTFGDVMANIAIRLNIKGTPDSFMKWSKDNPLSLEYLGMEQVEAARKYRERS